MKFRNQLFLFCIAAILLSTGNFALAQKYKQEIPNTQKLEVPMTSPQDALKMMELPEGFKSTLFAAEPDVHQPISVTTDARGRLWVAECYTYSDRKENYNTELNDRIVIFEDTDNDGKFDKRKIFWDKGKKLTSVEVGMGGVWITAAPNLMFIPDRNRDDIPDSEPIVLLDGFEGDVIRHNIVNGLRWGPDGWLYGRHGIQATSFVGPPGSTDSQRIAMNCSIWRIHPVTKKFEIVAQGGTNPWGFDYDEHGEMFMINTVIGHLFHVVPNARYRRMYGAHFNPHLYGVIEQTADHFHWDTAEEHWAVTKKDGMSDGTDKAGGGHAHTGLMIYQGNNWPKEFQNQLYTANFHGRRINSDTIDREGNSYVSHHGPDYFKTADPWFRGIEMIYGPDGGVFLLDWSDIGECHENDGIHRTSGRIFKLTYGDVKKPEHKDLTALTDDQLIDLLFHDNEWYSRKARRLLQERATLQSKGAESQAATQLQSKLEAKLNALHDLKSPPNEVAKRVKDKLRVLWAIHSIAAKDNTQLLLKQARNPNEHIRAWAIRLLADGTTPMAPIVSKVFLDLAKKDPSGLVRLYIASSLPRFESPEIYRLAGALSRHAQDANDRVQPKLIWYGLEPHVIRDPIEYNPDYSAIQVLSQSKMPLLRKNLARRIMNEFESQDSNKSIQSDINDLMSMLANEKDPQVLNDILEGMQLAFKGWTKVKKPDLWDGLVATAKELNNVEISERVERLNITFGDGQTTDALKKLVGDGKADIATRRNAISTLANSSEAPELFELLKPHITNKALTNAVTKALVHCEEPEAAQAVIRQFKKMDPVGKTIAINTLVARPSSAKKLLGAIESGTIPRSFVSASHARQIMNMGDDKLTMKLADTWGEIRKTSAVRLKEIESVRKTVSNPDITASLKNGQDLYSKNCSACHTLFGKGGNIGPDLTGSDRRNLNYLLENILDPSATVATSYRSSIIRTEDGRVFTGVIANENDRVIELQTKDDLVTIDLKTVEARRLTKNSLMPEGLLNDLTPQETADLFAYLRK